jgi:hypothetical protein
MTDFPNGLPAGIQILDAVKVDLNAPENFYFHHVDFKPEMKASLQNGGIILCKTPEERDRLIAQHRPGIALSDDIKAQSKRYAEKLGVTFVDLPAGISML